MRGVTETGQKLLVSNTYSHCCVVNYYANQKTLIHTYPCLQHI